jgi:upstream activation factor subunit UAF30
MSDQPAVPGDTSANSTPAADAAPAVKLEPEAVKTEPVEAAAPAAALTTVDVDTPMPQAANSEPSPAVKSEPAAVKSEPAVAAAAASSPPAAKPAVKSATPSTSAFPSTSTIRIHLRRLLSTSVLSTLTPKLVRSSLAKTLRLQEENQEEMEHLKKEIKGMLQTEIDRQAKEGNDTAAAASPPKEKSGKKEASPSKSKKRKDESKEGDDADGSPKKKRAKKDSSSSSSATGAADEDAEIARMAAEAENDGDEGEDEEDDAPAEKKSQEELDAELAASLAQADRRPRRAAAPISKPPRKPKKDRAPRDPDAPKKMATILGPLSELFGGAQEMNRGDVVRELWTYVRANNLQDPKNKQYILCDDKLAKLFAGKKRVHMFGMHKQLQKWIKNTDQLAE